jgi:Flp pilus assembly protein TadG
VQSGAPDAALHRGDGDDGGVVMRQLAQAGCGQAAVEFALTLPVFLLLVMGILDLGRAVLYSNMLSNAAREGARAGVVRGPDGARPDEAQLCAIARGATRLPNAPAAATCGLSGDLQVTASRGTPKRADLPVRVELHYAFKPITPLVKLLVGDTVPLSASSSMFVE